jgi:ATP-dependent RNA helicase DeaD
LATQVELECEKLSRGREIRSVVLSGGKPIRRQIQQLESGVEIVIGTPGRVIDHIGRGTLQLGGVHYVVLDEADRMLDIGFRPDIEKILRRVPNERQTLLLSATVPGPVERLAQRYMNNPVMVNRSPADISADTIDQYYITVDKSRKFEALIALLELECPDQAIVFCRTKRGTDKVTRNLMNVFEEISSIHGDMAQNVRDRVMQRFRAGKVRVLVATDVMGRGIDVSGISHIINYDIPEFCDDYVHRVGRTGRAGRFGVAFTLVSPEEGPQLTSIEMRINKLLERVSLEGFADLDKPVGAPTERSAGALGIEGEKPAEGGPAKGGPRSRRHRKAL